MVSNSKGYYFVTAPSGTYTLTAQPRTGPTFTSYSESNVVLNGNIVKNITLAIPTSPPTSSPTPTPTPTPPPTQNPTQTPVTTPHTTHTKSPTPTLPSTQISISTNTGANTVGSKLDIAGVLSDKNGYAITERTAILSYAVCSSSSWTLIGSGKTNSDGEYSIQWLIEASGTLAQKQNGAETNNTLGQVKQQLCLSCLSRPKSILCRIKQHSHSFII